MIDGGAAVAGGAMGYVTVGAVVVVDVVVVAVVAAVVEVPDPTASEPARSMRDEVSRANSQPPAASATSAHTPPNDDEHVPPGRSTSAPDTALRSSWSSGNRAAGEARSPKEFQADARARRNTPNVTVRPSSETPSTATAKVGNAASLPFRPEVPVLTLASAP